MSLPENAARAYDAPVGNPFLFRWTNQTISDAVGGGVVLRGRLRQKAIRIFEWAARRM